MRATMLCVCLLSGICLSAESRADGYDHWNPLRPQPQPPHLVLRQHAAPQPPASFNPGPPAAGPYAAGPPTQVDPAQIDPPQGHPVQVYPAQGQPIQGAMRHGQTHQPPPLHERAAELASRHSLKKDMAYVTGSRAPIPEATTELRQKTPYSYGYFGAIEKRHWSMHFGSRQNFTRWAQR